MTSQGNPQKSVPDRSWNNPLKNLEPCNLHQDSKKDSHLQQKIQPRTINENWQAVAQSTFQVQKESHTAKALLGTSCWQSFFIQYKFLCQTNFLLNDQQLKSNPNTRIKFKLDFSLNSLRNLPSKSCKKYCLASSTFKQLTGICF